MDIRGFSTAEVPTYLVEMVRRRPPAGCGVMPGTVPVVSFGDARTARVGTLGINPSSAEFATGGRFLPEADRRLATLDSLGARDAATLTDEQVASVIDQCFRYFDVNPYGKWFNRLDSILTLGLGASYYDGSACHLDLVQWATDPVWGKLDKDQRRILLDDGAPHLAAQLDCEHIDLVVVNGDEAWRQLRATGLVQWEDAGSFRWGTNAKSCKLRVGSGRGVTFVGWTLNVQSSFGVRSADRQGLAEWLASVAPQTRPQASTTEGALDRTTVTSKNEFAALLRHWYTGSDAETIGTIGSYGGSAHLILTVDDHVIALNADTKRSAVAKYLAHVDALGADAAWRVLLNSKGVANKVDFAPSGPPTPGWYCYLKMPLAGEGSV